MLFQFPYTNLYNLNLDWMIKAIKEMQEIVEPLDRVVNSVNNMTGDVVLTKAFLLNILESMVSKFNGRAGDVTLTAADVNQTLIDITWTSDPGDVIGDISQNVLNQMYAEGKRVLIFVNNLGVPDTIYFLTLVGDVVTPQLYSPTAALAGVASFNGQTGAVTATGSDLDTANDDDTPISESIEDLQSAVNEQSQQIDDLGPLNVLTSDSTTAALSAAQGKALKGLIDNLGPNNGQATTTTGEIISSTVYKFGPFVIANFVYKHGSGNSINIELPYNVTETIYFASFSILRDSNITLSTTANTKSVNLVSGAPGTDTNYMISLMYYTND